METDATVGSEEAAWTIAARQEEEMNAASVITKALECTCRVPSGILQVECAARAPTLETCCNQALGAVDNESWEVMCLGAESKIFLTWALNE
jgi:hypothetical protein